MNHSLKTRVLSMILAVVMLIGLVPMNVFATETESQSTAPVTVTVKFDVNGGKGDYEDQMVVLGEKITKPEENPTHDSATFAYWTADLDKNEEWDFEEGVVETAENGEVTLYASWINPVLEEDDPVAASYTVQHHLQNAEGGYDLVETDTETLTGEVGSTTAAVAKAYEGYAANEISQSTIAGDNTTVVAIYYDVVVADPEPTEAEPKETESVTTIPEGIEFFAFNGFVSETHDVFSRTQSTIAPGVTQDIIYAYSKDGKQMAYYVAIADINRDDVAVYANYKDNQSAEFGMQKLTEQMAAAQKRNTTDTTAPYYNPYYTAVAGVNGDFYNMTTGRPSGAFAMEGTVVNASNNRPFFAIMEDGTPVIGYGSTDWNTYIQAHGAVQEAVGGSQVLVFGGKDVTANASGDYNLERHCRTCVGVTADGKIVLMSLDGRQEPFSCGGTMHELAQIMLEQGCVAAINLDGGGSTTFAARQEGANDVTVVNRPSDGSERTISSSLLIVSTTPPSDVFERAVLTAEEFYVTPGAAVTVTAAGVSPAGTTAEIPETAVWQLADSSLGSVVDGVFTSNGTAGDAVVQLAVDGKVVGETTISVVIPETISFDYSDIIVPYGKSVKLTMFAYVNNGLNKVALKEGDFVFELSDEKLGTISGSTFTACAEDAALTGGKVTATFVCDESLTATANLIFGRGSSVVYDFEDGSTDGFDIKSAYFHKGPKYGRFGNGSYAIATNNSGMVKNGEKALAVTLDYSNYNNMGWKAVGLSGLNIDLTDAIAVGMWMYIPSEAIGMVEIDLNNSVIVDSYLKELQSEGFDGGWFYVSTTDIAGLGGSLDSLVFYHQDGYDGAEDDANIMTEYTVYIDDITVDYSSAVGDRNVPEFEYVRVSYGGLSDAVAITGQTIDTNVVSATVRANDNDALDMSSAKVYVDGVALSANQISCTDTGIITTDDIVLADGVHKFTFSVSDVTGNTKTVTRSLTVAAVSGTDTVKFVPDDPDADKVYMGSVQWFNLVATDIEAVSSVVTTIDLDNNSQWQLDNMVVAPGFTASYQLNPVTNDATITITKSGELEAIGEAILVSLPVRTWEHTNHLTYPKDVYTACSTGDSDQANSPHTVWKTDAMNRQSILITVDYGVVNFVDNTATTFSSEEYQVDTELAYHRFEKEASAEIKALVKATYSIHAHKAGEAQDKAATCTEAGYTGRVFCVGCDCYANPHSTDPSEGVCTHGDGCGSVITWGTTIPATGHTYETVGGVRKCACGKLFNGTYEGVDYIDGVALSGWVGDSYYVDGEKLSGIQKVVAPEGSGEYYYDFGTDGICQSGVKYTGLFLDEANGVYRYSKLGILTSGWNMIDNEWYYFNPVTEAAVNGEFTIDYVTYVFEENGRLTSGVWITNSKGTKYSYGPAQYYTGWEVIDGQTYYFDKAYRYEGYRYVVESNSKIQKWFDFGNDGALVGELDYTGLLVTEIGTYYLKNGISQQGLFYVDGYYYYFPSATMSACKNGTYSIANTNGLDLPLGSYRFDEFGRIILRNGIIEEDGALYYYKNDARVHAGLIKIGADYYYVKTGGIVVTGQYYVSNTNGLMEMGYYEFGADGKMKNGIVNEDGTLYYYVNGNRANGGLMMINGGYYYVRSNCQVAVGTYYVSNTNGLLPAGNYIFAEDGKMMDGIVEIDGVRYYYVNGNPVAAGLIQIGNDYYYVRTGGKLATGYYYCNSTNGLLEKGYYNFDDEGKLKNGIVSEEGALYYYVMGHRATGGLMIIDGDYYYVRSSSQLATGSYYCNTTNGLLPAGTYEFGADGRMLDGIHMVDGTLYYFVNGVRTAAGMIELNGSYYYVRTGGKLAIGYYYCNSTNGLLPAGFYTFGADGSMIK